MVHIYENGNIDKTSDWVREKTDEYLDLYLHGQTWSDPEGR